MHSVAPTGSISSLIASVRALGERFLTLVTLEGKQAGLSLAWMLGLALAAAVLAVYQAAGAELRRRRGAPVVTGVVLLGAIELGYLGLGRGKPKRPGHQG